MKFTEPDSRPTLEELRARVNGRQANRKRIRVDRDSHLRINDDDTVSLIYTQERWVYQYGLGWHKENPVERELVHYKPDHMVITHPPKKGDIATVYNRLRSALGEYGIPLRDIRVGPDKGCTSIYDPHEYDAWILRNPPGGHFDQWDEHRRAYAVHTLRDIPLRVEEPTRVGYHGEDLDNKRLPEHERKKIGERFLKRSRSSKQAHKAFAALGFEAFEPGRFSVSLEQAEALNAVARNLGFRNVADAYRRGVNIRDHLNDEDMELLLDGVLSLLLSQERNENR